jgi:hypothetical protein
MSTGVIIVVVIAVLAVAAGAVFLLRPQVQSRRLRRRFGVEYNRALEEHGDRRAAESELAERERRHSGFELRALDPRERDRYQQEWTEIQTRFVDSPSEAVAVAERLVSRLVSDLGYPDEGYQRQLADLSVEHAASVGHYRAAHDAHARDNATTEDLRGALLGYRTVLTDLLDRRTEVTPTGQLA